MRTLFRAGLIAALFHAQTLVTAQTTAPVGVAADVPRNAPASLFDPPTRLKAQGHVIDSGPSWGHSGPCLRDIDGDGKRELVVADFSGLFRLYRDHGKDHSIEYVSAGNLQAGGIDARVPIYCCIGPSPRFADLDGDSLLDLYSGSYDPGEIYLFRGVAPGKFAAREPLKDTSGRSILKEANDRYPSNSFASWPALVDWDDDGDFDLLVGTQDGLIFLRQNSGTPRRPEFVVDNEWVQVGDKPLRVPSGADATPIAADWDGDGRWDLITGSAAGGAYWYRNTGQHGHPRFDIPVTLIPKHSSGDGYNERLEPRQEPIPGIRSQLDVVDYDGDGKLDILLGDFQTNFHLKPNLSAVDRRKFNDAPEAFPETRAKARAAMLDLRAAWIQRLKANEMKGIPESEWSRPAYTARLKFLNAALEASVAFQSAEAEYLGKSLMPYVDLPQPTGDLPMGFDAAVPHGYVWLFRRR